MEIQELRKTVSRNKKYKYIYEVVSNNRVISMRHSSKDYAGCYYVNGKWKFFSQPASGREGELVSIILNTAHKGVALTFDSVTTIMAKYNTTVLFKD